MWKLGVAKQLHVTEWKHLRHHFVEKTESAYLSRKQKKGGERDLQNRRKSSFLYEKNNLWALMRRIESLKCVIFAFSSTFWRDKTILERNKHLIITMYLYFICSNFSPSTAIHICCTFSRKIIISPSVQFLWRHNFVNHIVWRHSACIPGDCDTAFKFTFFLNDLSIDIITLLLILDKKCFLKSNTWFCFFRTFTNNRTLI